MAKNTIFGSQNEEEEKMLNKVLRHFCSVSYILLWALVTLRSFNHGVPLFVVDFQHIHIAIFFRLFSSTQSVQLGGHATST